MRRKGWFKHLFMLGGIACFGMAIMASPAATISVQAAPGGPGISTMSVNEDKIEWVVYNFDGYVYRRLYNFSTGNWIGEWEYIGTYEEIFGPNP